MLISVFDYVYLYQQRWGKRDHSIPQIDKPLKTGQLWKEVSAQNSQTIITRDIKPHISVA